MAIYQHEGEHLPLIHVVNHNTCHYSLLGVLQLKASYNVVLLSTFFSGNPGKEYKLCMLAHFPQHNLVCLTKLTKLYGTKDLLQPEQLIIS